MRNPGGDVSSQYLIYTLCVACLMVDGFDLQALSFAAPYLVRDWKISSAVMGPVFSAALAGILVGSFLLSMLADRIGRRPVLIGATFWFAVLTYFVGQAASVRELTILRFIAGVGLGGIMPNAVALAGESAPARRRVLTMMVVSSGFTAGALMAGVAAGWLIPYSGWRLMFTFGAGASVLVGIALAALLPESPGMVAQRTGREVQGLPLAGLFRENRGTTTVLLWVLNFMNLLNLYFLTNWLPTAVRDFGFSNVIAVRAGTFVQVGGLGGGLALGVFAHRFGLVRVLTGCFLLGCVSFGMISRSGLPVSALLAVSLLAGLSISGGQVGVNALTADCYPTLLRATGIGAALGAGRVGAILGPAIAGALLLRQWQPRTLFVGAMVPAILSVVTVLLLRGSSASRDAAPSSSPDC